MKYTVEEAKEYSNRNEIDKWVQLFLRDICSFTAY
jgi:hypothetical protein